MSRSTIDPDAASRPDGRLGLVFEDQRTADLRQVVYADAHVVSSATRQTPQRSRIATPSNVRWVPGTRSDRTPGRASRAAPPTDSGTPSRPTSARTAGRPPTWPRRSTRRSTSSRQRTPLTRPGRGRRRDRFRRRYPDVAFEEVPGIGPKTAGNLRTCGYVTERDVRGRPTRSSSASPASAPRASPTSGPSWTDGRRAPPRFRRPPISGSPPGGRIDREVRVPVDRDAERTTDCAHPNGVREKHRGQQPQEDVVGRMARIHPVPERGD